MKKRMHKLCTILTASALLAMSVTVYAAEGDNTEAGFQPAEEGTVQSADTEQTEEKDPEENGLDSFIYIREKEDKSKSKKSNDRRIKRRDRCKSGAGTGSGCFSIFR